MRIRNLPYKMGWAGKLLIKKLHNYIDDFNIDSIRETASIFEKIMAKNIEFISNAPSQTHIMACAYVMATYKQMLANGDSREAAIDKLTWAFQQPGRLIVTWPMRIWLWFSHDAKNGIVRENQRKVKSYGKEFKFSDERGEFHYTSVVNVCGYHEFFKRNLCPELTVIFCEWDVLWADEIGKQDCGIRFERPCTLGRGGECCRFEFHFDEIH